MPIDAQRICDRCDELARHSEQADGLTRIFLSPEQKAVTGIVGAWMTAAGMSVRVDAIGNVVGRYEGDRPDPRGGVRWIIPEKAKYWP